MWDDERDPDSPDESNGSGIRRKSDPPLDLPLSPDSGVRLPAEAAPTKGLPPPATASPVRRRKAPPLFPDWDPGEGPTREAPPFSRWPGRPEGARGAPDLVELEMRHELPAPVGSRGGAGAADLVAVALVAGILLLSVRLVGGAPLTRGTAVWTGAFVLELVLLAGALSLFLFGRTPGMALANLRAEEPDGEPVRFGRAALRTVVSLGGVCLPGVGLLVSALRDDRRALTDLASGTVLRFVEEPFEEPPEEEPPFVV